MSLSIRTNVASLNAQRNLVTTQNALDGSLSRLSSGFRITRAGDDAAGLGISAKLESQIRSYSQATRNANDGLSVVQASESALNEQSSILVRLRELAMQSSSDGIGDAERGYVDKEAQALLGELDRIAQVTEYNGAKLLNGTTASGLDFQVGIGTTANDVITLKALNVTTAGGAGSSGAPAAAFTTAARNAWVTSMTSGAAAGDLAQAWNLANQAALAQGATAEMADRATFALEEMFFVGFYEAGGSGFPGPGAALDAGVALVQQAASSAGGSSPLMTQMFQAYADALAAGGGDTQAAIDAVRSLTLPVGVNSAAAFDGANAAYDTFKASFLAAGGDPFFQSGDVVTLGSPEVLAGLAALTGGGVGVGGGGSATGGLGVTGLSLASKSSAQGALGTIDAAIGTLSSARAELGASGNRLQSAIANIQAFSESLSAANSRIKDVDVAEETSRMARSQILSQAGVSVLAQANQMPQLALKLLG